MLPVPESSNDSLIEDLEGDILCSDQENKEETGAVVH